MDGPLVKVLSDEVLLEVFKHLQYHELWKVALVCTRWHTLCKDPLLIKELESKAEVVLQSTLRFSRSKTIRCLQEFHSKLWCGGDTNQISVWNSDGSVEAVIDRSAGLFTNDIERGTDWLAITTNSGSVEVYRDDGWSYDPCTVFSIDSGTTMFSLKFWKDKLFGGGYDGSVCVWDCVGKVVWNHQRVHCSIVRLFQPWGRVLYSAADDRTVGVYHEDGRVINKMTLTERHILSLAVFSDTLYIGCYGTGHIYAWKRTPLHDDACKESALLHRGEEPSCCGEFGDVERPGECCGNEQGSLDQMETYQPMYAYHRAPTLIGHEDSVDVLYVWRGRLLSASRNAEMRVWDDKGLNVQVIRTLGSIRSMTMWNGDVVAGTGEGVVLVYGLRGMKTILRTKKRQAAKRRMLRLSNSTIKGS